jgi:hypothetical protein
VRTLNEIRRLYFQATPKTIQRDLTRAVELFKSLPDDEARAKAAVYMDGLSLMRSEWAAANPTSRARRKR